MDAFQKERESQLGVKQKIKGRASSRPSLGSEQALIPPLLSIQVRKQNVVWAVYREESASHLKVKKKSSRETKVN